MTNNAQTQGFRILALRVLRRKYPDTRLYPTDELRAKIEAMSASELRALCRG